METLLRQLARTGQGREKQLGQRRVNTAVIFA